jgi:signal transduction histidine kinase
MQLPSSRVNKLGEALEGLGRWYVAVPPLLIVGFLAALFILTGAGQARLQAANERLQATAAREHALDQLQDSMTRSVAAQRSFLLTGDTAYADAYDAAAAEAAPELDRLRQAYTGSDSALATVRTLRVLIGKRLADLAMLVALQESRGSDAAVALLKAQPGAETGDAMIEVFARLRAAESHEHDVGREHWAAAVTQSRWITFAGTVFNMLLVGIAARLVYLDMQRRTELTAELRDHTVRLEREVLDRTRELVELSTHLQSVAEREKASLARELHDELGGLLVGARMDISWAEQHLAKNDPDMKLRLQRVQQNLSAGVDLKRRIIEELRPTLLDNVGLFAAIRWQLKVTCAGAGLKCTQSYPDVEPKFTSEASIALFRIAQEAFTNILKHSGAKSMDMTLEFDGDSIVMQISDDGNGISADQLSAIGSHGLASMRHRVRALGGQLDVKSPAAGGTLLLVRIPTRLALLPGEADRV